MQTKWLIRLLAVAGVILLVSAVLRLLTPQSPPVPNSTTITTNTDGTKTTFSNVTFTGQAIVLPSTLSIVSYTAQASPIVDQLITDYKLATGSGVFKVWRGIDYNMVLSQQTDQYSLAANVPTTSDKPGLNAEQAAQVAQNFATKYFGPSTLTLLTNEVVYGATERDNLGSPDQALAAQIPFSYVIDNYPVSLSANNLYPLVITVDNTYHLTDATFIPATLKMTSLGKKPTISVTEALANINKGQAAVTSVFQENFQPIDLASITSATMTSVKVQYRVDAATNLVYPFYIFSGKGTNAQNTALDLEISTPAVAISSQ